MEVMHDSMGCAMEAGNMLGNSGARLDEENLTLFVRGD